MILVTSYVNADLDGTASAIAYAELLSRQGMQARAVLSGTPHAEAVWAMQRVKVTPPLAPTDEELVGANIIVVDTTHVSALDHRIDPRRVTEVIDHRAIREVEVFTEARLQLELVGSCATLIAERFKAIGVSPHTSSARLLALAIASNTIHLKAPETTERDRTMFSWLRKESGLTHQEIVEMFRAKSVVPRDEQGLYRHLASDVKSLDFSGHRVTITQLEIAGVADFLRESEMVLPAVLSKLQQAESGDYILLVAIDVMLGQTYLVAPDPGLRTILQRTVNASFRGATAQLDGIHLRKSIGPKLKAYLGGPEL